MRDGLAFENKVMQMVARFQDADQGVEFEDVERAMRAEKRGDTEMLNGILSRQIRAGQRIANVR